jgi:beta-galactosidase
VWYGAAYYPEHRDRARWEYDLDNMAEAGINALRVGEFAWKRFEPKPGQYDFSWLDEFQELANQRDIRLVLCPPLRTVPAWLVEKDPTILIELHNGVCEEYGSRYTFCINHPLLREKGSALAETLARHYADTEILAWHLDNEQGDEHDCHCPICKAQWQGWLRKRFGDIERLNQAWGMVFWGLEFDHFGQVPTPRITKVEHNPGLLLAWRQFRNDCTIEMMTLQANAIRKFSSRPVTTNFQPTWNPRTDYFEAAQCLDACGTNYYPPFGPNYMANEYALAATRGFRQQNFSVFELRNGPHLIPGRGGNTAAPGEIERLVLHTIAHGADAIYFFRWRACPFGLEQSHGSITGYDGQRLRVFDECKKTGERLRRIAPLLSGTQVVSEVAILLDFRSRWYLESGSPWQSPKTLYMDLLRRLYAALRRQGVNVDITGRRQDWTAYKLLVVPCCSVVTQDMSEKIRRYVEQGGAIVWHPLGGIVDEHAVIYPDRLHPQLAELFGVRPLDVATGDEKESGSFSWHGHEYACQLFFELPQVTSGDVTAKYTSGWHAGQPAIVERNVGRGTTVYIATFPTADFYRDLFSYLLKNQVVIRKR